MKKVIREIGYRSKLTQVCIITQGDNCILDIQNIHVLGTLVYVSLLHLICKYSCIKVYQLLWIFFASAGPNITNVTQNLATITIHDMY